MQARRSAGNTSARLRHAASSSTKPDSPARYARVARSDAFLSNVAFHPRLRGRPLAPEIAVEHIELRAPPARRTERHGHAHAHDAFRAAALHRDMPTVRGVRPTRQIDAWPSAAPGPPQPWRAGVRGYRRVASSERGRSEDSASNLFIIANADTRGLLQINKLRCNAHTARQPGTDEDSRGKAWAGDGRLMRSRQHTRTGTGRSVRRDTEAPANAASRKTVSVDAPATDAAQRNAASSAGPTAVSTSTSKGCPSPQKRAVGKRCGLKMRSNRGRRHGMHVRASWFRGSDMAMQKRAWQLHPHDEEQPDCPKRNVQSAEPKPGGGRT